MCQYVVASGEMVCLNPKREEDKFKANVMGVIMAEAPGEAMTMIETDPAMANVVCSPPCPPSLP